MKLWTSVSLLATASLLSAGCQSSQETFATPAAAADRLVAATAARDASALKSLLGSRMSELGSGDPEQDKADFQRFSAALEREHKLIESPDGTMLLEVGGEGWTFPAPIIPDGKKWRFDTAAGIEELTDRRVGDNEISTIAACRYYVDAQHAFFDADPDHDGVKTYAQRIVSTEGHRDGLYWPDQPGEPESPLGPQIQAAVAAGDLKANSPRPGYLGYRYKILKAAGPGAPGGAKSYLDPAGHLTGGFALIAWPVDYGHSGVMTFLVGPDGKVHERNLGASGNATATATTDYDPAAPWKPVQDSDKSSVMPISSPVK